MPIKELQFSFKISVEALAKALADSNHGMDIQVLGTQPIDLVPTEDPKLLAPPEKGLPRQLILAHMRAHPNESFTSGQLAALCAPHHVSTDRVYATVYYLCQSRLLRRYHGGKYRLTKAGAHD